MQWRASFRPWELGAAASCRSWKISWSTSFRNERRSAQKQTWNRSFCNFHMENDDEPADLGYMVFRPNAYDWIRFPSWPRPSICFPLPGYINTRHNRWANLGSEACHLLVAAGTSTGGYSWPTRRIVRTFPICLMWSAYACLPVLWQGLLGFCKKTSPVKGRWNHLKLTWRTRWGFFLQRILDSTFSILRKTRERRSRNFASLQFQSMTFQQEWPFSSPGVGDLNVVKGHVRILTASLYMW